MEKLLNLKTTYLQTTAKFWMLFVLLIALTACRADNAVPTVTQVALGEVDSAESQESTTPIPPATATQIPTIAASPTQTHTPTPQPTATPQTPSPTPLPTSTPTASATPTPTNTPTPTATPRSPLMIEVMREADYPGSEIVFEEKLEPGENYDRWVVSYQSEGNKIFALVTRPFGPKPANGFPLIIFNHGWIEPSEYRTTERYVDYVDAFASNGYMVFRSDYRGHGFSEGEAIIAYRSPGYTIDVLNGMAAAKTLPSADPNRVGMWGHSMGGWITLQSMVIDADIKAGVIWGGVVVSYPELFELWRRGSDDGPTPTPDPTREARLRRGWYGEYGSPEENPEYWSSISANSYVADLSGPIQLHHGLADDVVPSVFSEILHDNIQAVGGVSETFFYQGDNHNISFSFDAAMQRSVAFFDRYVKNSP